MINRQFISTSKPLAKAASLWAFNHYNLGEDAFALDKKLFILPTRNAGRIFKESLLRQCSSISCGGILSLNIKTFEDIFSQICSFEDELNAFDTASIWVDILSNANRSDYYSLFPDKFPDRKNFTEIALSIEKLKADLSENALTIKDALEKLSFSKDFNRWQELAKLDEEFEKRASLLNKKSHSTSLLDSVLKQKSFLDIKEIVILANTEISGLCEKWLTSLSENGTDICIAIYADESECNNFDNFGRPKTEYFCNTKIDIEGNDLYVFADIQSEVVAICNIAKLYGSLAHKALGIACDQDNNVDLMVSSLSGIVNAISLKGKTCQNTAIYSLLKIVADYLNGESSERDFLQNAYIAKYIEQKFSLNITDALTAFDCVYSITLAQTLQDACDIVFNLDDNAFLAKKFISFIDNKEAFLFLADFVEAIKNTKDFKSFKILIAKFFDIKISEQEDIAINLLKGIFEKSIPNNLNISEILKILMSFLSGSYLPSEAEKDSIALQDWIEIFWNNAPHIILADMNCKIVPLERNTDMFLNDASKTALGLRNKSSRYARDAYMLKTLYFSKKNCGQSVSILTPRKDINSDPLMPSPLLLQNSNLANSVRKLFSNPQSDVKDLYFNSSWGFSPKVVNVENKLAVSDFKNYLISPWNFYLSRILKAEIFENQKNEMSAADFGSLFHSCFESFARSKFKDASDEKTISDYLIKICSAKCYEQFGTNLKGQLLMQVYSLKQRLKACALQQSLHRTANWQILDSEKSFSIDIEGFKVAGRFDRIDINHIEKKILVIDYKTFEKAKPNCVVKNHVKNEKALDSGEPIEWLDLQLPLYYEAASQIYLQDYKDYSIDCAYFLAPKSVGETRIETWLNLNQNIVDNAKAKAAQIINAIKLGKFEDANPPKFDNFSDMFSMDFELRKKLTNFYKDEQ